MLTKQAAVRPARIEDKAKIGLANYLRGSQYDNITVRSRFNAKSYIGEEAFTLDIKALEVCGGRHGNTNVCKRVSPSCSNSTRMRSGWLSADSTVTVPSPKAYNCVAILQNSMVRMTTNLRSIVP